MNENSKKTYSFSILASEATPKNRPLSFQLSIDLFATAPVQCHFEEGSSISSALKVFWLRGLLDAAKIVKCATSDQYAYRKELSITLVRPYQAGRRTFALLNEAGCYVSYVSFYVDTDDV